MLLQEGKVEIIDENQQKKPDLTPVPEGVKQIVNNQNYTNKRKGKKSIAFYIAIFIAILFFLAIIAFGGFTIYNLNNSEVIAKGIYIYGMDVSGKTKKDAINTVYSKFSKIQSSEIKLNSKDYETVINPSEISLRYNIEEAVNTAFSIGKTGKIFNDDYQVFNIMINGKNIVPTYSLDEKVLKSMLDNLSKELPNAVVESSYYIDGKDLVITKGSKGYVVDVDKTAESIISCIKDYSFLNKSISLSLKEQAPKDVDVDQIYSEVHKEPQNAYYTTNPYAVYPSKTGIDFKISLAEAKKKVHNADKECTITLKTLYPKITTNMIGKDAFPNLLGEFSTHYVSNPARTTNLRLAASKINGTVLLPGETFSYNKVVGERTIAAGYRNAAIYANGQVVDGLGGGICQISTTLFNAVLFANLDIVELHNHQFVPSYVGAGRDATVVYGSKDFKFKNTRNFAIKIQCSVSGGIANFKIYGVKEKPEYDVRVNASITSQTGSYTKSSTYRTLYLNGKRVSSERIYSCTYKRH